MRTAHKPLSSTAEQHEDRLLNTAHAAKFLDLHPATLRKWRSTGGAGPAWIVLPNNVSIRYSLSILKQWAGISHAGR